jgi:hypothetical protein
MAGYEIRQKGALLDGRAPRVVARVFRSWLQGALRFARDYARSIAPVVTGTYRRSIIFRTRLRAGLVEGDLYSTDVPGKVRVIEYGFPPRLRKRQPKTIAGPFITKGREARMVFHRTEQHTRGLFRTQARVLEAELVKELAR